MLVYARPKPAIWAHDRHRHHASKFGDLTAETVMAAIELMTWVATQKRWLKKYKGKMYAVSPKRLGVDATKEASRLAANDWWTKRQAEIDAAVNHRKHPVNLLEHYAHATKNHRIYAKWHRKYGSLEEAVKSEAMIEWLQEALKTPDPTYPLSHWQEDPTYEATLKDSTLWYLWQDRRRLIIREENASEQVPTENTARSHIDHHLKTKKALGKGTIGTYQTYKERLTVFRKWVEPSAPITAINETLWEQYCVYLAAQVTEGKLSASTRTSQQMVARSFIRDLWERHLIELPRNLNSKMLAVSAPIQTPDICTKADITTLLNAADERTELCLLLMLNCGFYAVDIGKLRQDEVDWKAGRIIRKRSKTKNRSDKVPKVSYLLWHRTFELLKQFRNATPHHPELALVNEENNPLWWEYEKDGKYVANNTVKCLYFRLLSKTLKIPAGKRKPLKTLRKTASSKLDEHDTYGRYVEHFLGEAPSSVANRHYVQPSTKQFDRAITWLGKQFGLS